jgi:hypothetical protein
MWRMTRWAAFALLLAAVSCTYNGGYDSHEAVFSDEGLLSADARDLDATVVTPHLEMPVETGQNLIWCSSFQLAWNEVSDLIAEDVRLSGDPPMAAVLNKRAASRADVDDESYVALAGFIGDGIVAKIRKALAEKFAGRASARLQAPAGTVRPQDVFAYAYLFKNLQFAVPFERIETPVNFKGVEVSCFGVSAERRTPEAVLDQVLVLDYVGADDFVIELVSKSADDRIILAKVPPADTLAGAVAAIRERVAGAEGETMRHGEVLKVPRFNFDVLRRYDELEGRRLISDNGNVPEDSLVVGALQSIRFEMNEKGVRLRSEAHLAFGCSAGVVVPQGRRMVFDKPFAIIMERRGASAPYFAMWVANGEMLLTKDR